LDFSKLKNKNRPVTGLQKFWAKTERGGEIKKSIYSPGELQSPGEKLTRQCSLFCKNHLFTVAHNTYISSVAALVKLI
jgi:hypothetical protein